MNYRHLTKGEIIRAGDEIDNCNNAWHDEPKWEKVTTCFGEPAPDPQYVSHRQYRRPIAEESREPTHNMPSAEIARCGVFASCPYFRGVGKPCTYKGACSKRATSHVG